MAHKISSLKALGGGNINAKSSSGPHKPRRIRSILGLVHNSTPDEPLDQYMTAEYTAPFSNTSFWCLFVQSLPLVVIFPIRHVLIWFFLAALWVTIMTTRS
jgi:hypothetical protein